jgi:hypothetical protein
VNECRQRGQSRGVGVAFEEDWLADGFFNRRAKLESVPAGEVWRVPDDAGRELQRAWTADTDAQQLAMRAKTGTQSKYCLLQVTDHTLAALSEAGRKGNELGDLIPGTICSDPEICASEVDPQRKLTFNRFAGHFSDHFASNQQKLAPLQRFRVVRLAHRF